MLPTCRYSVKLLQIFFCKFENKETILRYLKISFARFVKVKSGFHQYGLFKSSVFHRRMWRRVLVAKENWRCFTKTLFFYGGNWHQLSTLKMIKQLFWTTPGRIDKWMLCCVGSGIRHVILIPSLAFSAKKNERKRKENADVCFFVASNFWCKHCLFCCFESSHSAHISKLKK